MLDNGTVLDDFVGLWNDYLKFFVFGAAIIVVLLFVTQKVTRLENVQPHKMEDSVICYTFHTSIDCVQVNR